MKRFIALICLASMLFAMLPMAVSAADSNIIDHHGAYNLRMVERDGIYWRLSDSVKGKIDTKGTSAIDDDTYCEGTVVDEVGYVNAAGNIEACSDGTTTMIPYHAYGAYIYSRDNTHEGAPFGAEKFTENYDFETKMKIREQLLLILSAYPVKVYLNFYDESKLTYQDKNNESRAIELDIGREVITYEVPRGTNDPQVEFRTYKHELDRYNKVEIEYVKVTPVDAQDGSTSESFYINTISQNEVFAEGETIHLKTNLSTENRQAKYYVDDVYVGEDKLTTTTESGECEGDPNTTTNDGFNLSGLEPGIHRVTAECDGKTSKALRIFVSGQSGEVNTEYSNSDREYILDYTYDGTEGAKISVNDGYFGLDFTHWGNAVSYLNEKGEVETYTGTGRGIGAGDYRIVATAGYAEVYYNGQFAFSCYLNLNYASKGTNYSNGITNFNLQKSGVKKERYFRQLNGEEEIADYSMSFDKFYSAEFDKKDSSSETIVIYDGEYQAKLFFDEDGITAMSQFEDYEPATEFKLCDIVEPGYYRLTVASGLAQLFRNNVYINSFKCPAISHKDAVFRKMSNPSAATFIAIKDTDDIYFHSEDFEGNTEIDALKYFESEKNGLIVEESAEIPFTQEIVAEDGNSYLKISDTGLQKEVFDNVDESVVCETVGDFNLSMNADFPNFKWRAKTDSSWGRIHFIGRHIQKGEMMTAGYDLDAKQWFIKKYVRKQYAYTNASGGTSYAWYDSEETIATASGALDANWHNYEMKFAGDSMIIFCDGTAVVSCNGLVTQHGKVGFGVSGGASLCVDDIEYSGEGKASPGINYLSQYGIGSKGFAYNPVQGGVIAGNASYSSYITKDGGKTWESYYAYPGSYNLNLISGGYIMANPSPSGSVFTHMLYAAYTPKYAYENGGAANNYSWYWFSDYKNNPYNMPEGFVIGGYDDYRDPNRYALSLIPGRLVQAKDGKYKGRIFITYSVGEGERYGGEALYYTDADALYDPNDTRYWDGMGSKPADKEYYPVVWTQSVDRFIYDEQGVNLQESLIVDMPDSVIRMTGRCDEGFLFYADSFDGGSTFEQLKPMQLISPRCSYGMVRDPDNLNHYYTMFEYEANTSDKQNDGGRPRTRLALAVSYDAMKSWYYLADLEELTDNWKTSKTPQNHSLQIIDGVLYMSYSGTGGAYSKLFTMDVSDVKPLKRFSEVHKKVEFYDDVAGNKINEVCVIPKESGKGTLYGETYEIDDWETFIADAEAQGKSVSETAYGYVIADVPQTRMLNHYLENSGLEKTFEQDEISDFLNSMNVAAENNRQDIVEELLNRYEHILGFTPEFSGAVPDDVYRKMTEFEYVTLDSVKQAFDISVNILTKEGGLAFSTKSQGTDEWEFDATAVTVEDGIITIAGGEIQNTAFEVPETENYIVSFDVFMNDGETVTVKWGNEEQKIRMDINTDAQFGEIRSIIPLTVETNRWYTVTALVCPSDTTPTVTVRCKADGNDTVTESIFEDVVLTSGACGLSVGGSAQLRNVKVYSGKAFDVLAVDKGEETTDVILEFLNDNEEIAGTFEIVAAVYDGDRFVGSKTYPFSGGLKAYEDVIIRISDIPLQSAVENPNIKLFMWNNMKEFVPLAKAALLATESHKNIGLTASVLYEKVDEFTLSGATDDMTSATYFPYSRMNWTQREDIDYFVIEFDALNSKAGMPLAVYSGSSTKGADAIAFRSYEGDFNNTWYSYRILLDNQHDKNNVKVAGVWRRATDGDEDWELLEQGRYNEKNAEYKYFPTSRQGALKNGLFISMEPGLKGFLPEGITSCSDTEWKLKNIRILNVLTVPGE